MRTTGSSCKTQHLILALYDANRQFVATVSDENPACAGDILWLSPQEGAEPLVVYADILVCVNLIVNYALLMACGRLCRRTPHRMRILAASAIGAVYALLLFVNGLPVWFVPATKLLAGALMVRVAYVYRGVAEYIRQCVTLLFVSMLFGGLMLALWLFATPSGMLYEDGIVYFNISALALVGYTAVAYGITELFARLYHKKDVESGMVEVSLLLGNNIIKMRGFVDTGNSLCDAYTGYAVAVCGFRCVRSALPTSLIDIISSVIETEDFSRFTNLITPDTHNKFKLIPYSTVGFAGVLPAFLPDELRLDGVTVEHIYIAVAPEAFTSNDYDILLSPTMLPPEGSRGQRYGSARGARGKRQTKSRQQFAAGE